MTTRVGMVNTYSSGALLAPAFAKQGHECVAVGRKIPSSSARRSFPTTLPISWTPSRAPGATLQSSARLNNMRRVLAAPVKLSAASARTQVRHEREPSTAPRGTTIRWRSRRSRGPGRPPQVLLPSSTSCWRWTRKTSRAIAGRRQARFLASDDAVASASAELGQAHGAMAPQQQGVGSRREHAGVRGGGRKIVRGRFSYASPGWCLHRAPAGLGASVFHDTMEPACEGERQQALLSKSHWGTQGGCEIRYGPRTPRLIVGKR